VVNPGMEPELEPFSVEWKIGSRREKLFLPTSPELALKKMMAQGLSDIFEIKSVFRNEELTSLHEPEFLMLEWYRSFSDLELISQDLTELVNFLISFTHLTQSDKDPGNHLSADAPQKANQSIVIQKYTVAELFEQQLGYKLTPETSREQLLYWAKELKLIDVSIGQSEQKNDFRDFSHWDWNNLFYLIWVAKIEPHLPIEPFLLTNYPPSQAALARINEEGWADRLEFYWNRIEIANAFHELNDPQEQRLRFERDILKRKEYGRTLLSIDEEFMRALEQGLPPSGGIALGLERLFMALFNVCEIKNVRRFRK
ncbi:MAG: amino acid--tRNA ligase-related protein, partial [Bdellovibrionales bacterium]